jgi:hypothetical protein
MNGDAHCLFDRPVSDWHPKVRRLYEYWRKIHPPTGELPGRQHFDPVDIPNLLRYLWLLDIHRDPLRFRYRLLGTVHVAAMRRNLVGQWLDEVHPSFLTSPSYPQYVDLVTHRRASYRKGAPGFHVDPDLYEMERVILPLARNGRDVDMTLAITIYFRGNGSEAFP